MALAFRVYVYTSKWLVCVCLCCRLCVRRLSIGTLSHAIMEFDRSTTRAGPTHAFKSTLIQVLYTQSNMHVYVYLNGNAYAYRKLCDGQHNQRNTQRLQQLVALLVLFGQARASARADGVRFASVRTRMHKIAQRRNGLI